MKRLNAPRNWMLDKLTGVWVSFILLFLFSNILIRSLKRKEIIKKLRNYQEISKIKKLIHQIIQTIKWNQIRIQNLI